MHHIKSLIIFMIALLLLHVAISYGQEPSKVLLRDGGVLTGKVLETGADGSILFETSDGFTVTLKREDIYQVLKITYPSIGTFGVGLGIPYGAFGFGLDIYSKEVIPVGTGNQLCLTMGYGTTFFAGAAFDIGVKYYFREIGETWRPRVLALYGINSFIWDPDFDVEESFSGLTVGIGQQWTWGDTKRHGMDLDLIYIVTCGNLIERADELRRAGSSIPDEFGRTKISLGYRYCF